MRVLLIGVSTQIVTHFGARSAVLLMIGFLLFGFIGLYVCGRFMKSYAAPVDPVVAE